MHLKSMTILAASLFTASLFTSAARAEVINFDSYSTPTYCDAASGAAIDGFTLSADNGAAGSGIGNSGPCYFAGYTAHSGSNYAINSTDLYGALSKDDGLFDLLSLYIQADGRLGTTTVRLQGLDALGGNVLYSMDVTAYSNSWTQISFADWTGVKTFTWDPLTPDVANIQIDDFEYRASIASDVPEPATLGLLGAGLVGIALARRKRSRA